MVRDLSLLVPSLRYPALNTDPYHDRLACPDRKLSLVSLTRDSISSGEGKSDGLPRQVKLVTYSGLSQEPQVALCWMVGWHTERKCGLSRPAVTLQRPDTI